MNKVALITGGTKGIGLAIVERLLNEGYKVAFTGRNEHEIDRLNLTLEEKFPNKVLGIKADVQSFESITKAVERVIEYFGKLDILVANAGIGIFKNIMDLTIEDWDQTITTNLDGVFYSVKATLPHIIKEKGYIITMASLAGTNFFPEASAYNASKFGLVGFTQSLMLDVRKYDVKVTTIMPGSVATQFNNHVPSDADAWKIQPEDLGQMVVDLLNMPARTLPSKIEVRPSKTSN